MLWINLALLDMVAATTLAQWWSSSLSQLDTATVAALAQRMVDQPDTARHGRRGSPSEAWGDDPLPPLVKKMARIYTPASILIYSNYPGSTRSVRAG